MYVYSAFDPILLSGRNNDDDDFDEIITDE